MTTHGYDVPEIPPALGAVVEQERGSLPFALIHGEGLVACASWALGDAGVTPVDLGTPWAALVDSGEPFVLHDSLCPMTPASFVADCVNVAVEGDTVVVGVRPVTDTVKRVEAGASGTIGETVDRDTLVGVASPVVLPPGVLAALDGLPSLDFPELVHELRRRFPVRLLEAPPEGRRVGSPDELRLLEALTSR